MDIQHLLAFMARTMQKPGMREERLTIKEKIPSYSPIQSNLRRLVPILDSITNLCVKQKSHEVVAVALWVHNDVELLIATNTDVSPTTLNHLKSLWKALQQLSIDYYIAHRASGQSESSPPRLGIALLMSEAQNKEELFRRECLKFVWERLKNRVNKKFSMFVVIDRKGIDSESLFMHIYTCIVRLEQLYTSLGRPDSDDIWKALWYRMKVTERKIDAFLNDGGLHADDLWRVKDKWDYQQWLRKIASITKDIEIIMGAANSPKCRGIFAKRFKVTPIKMTLTTRNNILKTSQQ